MQTQLFFTFILLSITTVLFGQQTQKVRGTIVDGVTESPLTGATIVIIDSEPILGCTSDEQGHFSLENIPLGRIGLKISYIGYKDKVYQNLDLFAGKELILNISLEETVTNLSAVNIKAKIDKDRSINEIATVSARTFSVEETQRYAGSLGDPSRMAQNFAGVMSAGDSRNDIIIRGNSPMGLLWRLEGIDIPNPNHFGASGTTGGPVSILNNNLLANSDFFTGAFPAEYGNALSGVFDLQMRNGNNQQYEFVGQIGFNGFELGAEGPLSKNHKGSFLVDYRYSTLAVFDAIGLNSISGSSIPQYQDLTFKINLPTENMGRFVLYGIGGKSFIQIWDSQKEDDEASYGLSGVDTDFGSDMGVIGLYNTYYLNKKTRLKTNLAISGTRATTALDSLKGIDKIKSQFYRSSNSETKYSLSSHLTHKFSVKNILIAGIILDRYQVNFIDSVYRFETQDYFSYNNTKGGMGLYQAYAQWKHQFNEQFNFNIGLHYQFFDLNQSMSLEPRTGIEWVISEKQSLNLGYGLLSQIQPKLLYFVETESANGESVKTNLDLGFTKSNQLVLGYNNKLATNLRLKIETYYQMISNVPVNRNMPNYSVLNEGANFYISQFDSLINQGKGQNYGLELTVEKFLSKHYYFMATASLFSSTYQGYNEIEHPTAFDNGFVFNALGGYEIALKKNMRLNIDLKTVYSGGNPYTPIDEAASLLQNQAVYDYEKSYSAQHADYFRLDFKLSFRLSVGATVNEYSIEIQNLTNHQNIQQQGWDPINKEIKTDYQQGFFPMFMYRIYF